MTENIETYNLAFRDAYRFMEKHLFVGSGDEWDALVDDLRQFQTPFGSDMAAAVVNEIERRYKRRNEL